MRRGRGRAGRAGADGNQVVGTSSGQLHRRQRDGPADGVVEADVRRGVGRADQAEQEQQEQGEAVHGVNVADAVGRGKGEAAALAMVVTSFSSSPLGCHVNLQLRARPRHAL